MNSNFCVAAIPLPRPPNKVRGSHLYSVCPKQGRATTPIIRNSRLYRAVGKVFGHIWRSRMEKPLKGGRSTLYGLRSGRLLERLDLGGAGTFHFSCCVFVFLFYLTWLCVNWYLLLETAWAQPHGRHGCVTEQALWTQNDRNRPFLEYVLRTIWLQRDANQPTEWKLIQKEKMRKSKIIVS